MGRGGKPFEATGKGGLRFFPLALLECGEYCQDGFLLLGYPFPSLLARYRLFGGECFFIHLSVDECLGCFHVLGTVNDAINRKRSYLFEIVISLSSDVYLEVEFLNHLEGLFLI